MLIFFLPCIILFDVDTFCIEKGSVDDEKT